MNTMIGRLLRPFRAGERKLLWNDPRLRSSGEALEYHLSCTCCSLACRRVAPSSPKVRYNALR
jgi:hypothetical protein